MQYWFIYDKRVEFYSEINQVFTGNSSNETFTGGSGDDNIDGAAGIDTAVFTFAKSNYLITKTGSKILVKANPEPMALILLLILNALNSQIKVLLLILVEMQEKLQKYYVLFLVLLLCLISSMLEQVFNSWMEACLMMN